MGLYDRIRAYNTPRHRQPEQANVSVTRIMTPPDSSTKKTGPKRPYPGHLTRSEVEWLNRWSFNDLMELPTDDQNALARQVKSSDGRAFEELLRYVPSLQPEPGDLERAAEYLNWVEMKAADRMSIERPFRGWDWEVLMMHAAIEDLRRLPEFERDRIVLAMCRLLLEGRGTICRLQGYYNVLRHDVDDMRIIFGMESAFQADHVLHVLQIRSNAGLSRTHALL
jgi:hypothetical protein